MIDLKTRTLMTMNGMYHPRSDVDRLYVPRKEGGRVLSITVEVVESEVERLGRNVEEGGERPQESATALKKKRKEKKLKEYKGKSLHGKMISETESVMSAKSWPEGVMSAKSWSLVERRKDIRNPRTSAPNKLGKEEH